MVEERGNECWISNLDVDETGIKYGHLQHDEDTGDEGIGIVGLDACFYFWDKWLSS